MTVRCSVCPNKCIISENKFGLCGVRGCKNGQLYLPFSGNISASSTDPIEKKPLYHFHPGKNIYSIGFFGCSLSCPFCQNYSISKQFSRSAGIQSADRILNPHTVAEAAKKSGSFGIAFTYSEPIVHLEWVIECSEAARKMGLKTVIVTNGYINPEPALKLLKHIDAVNIDLKSFNKDFYREELGGSLEPVLDFINLAADSVHTELTTLVIPGKNDSIKEIEAASDFISGINPNMPWHLSAYYPSYKYNIPTTDPAVLMTLAKTASDKLNFVYTGNMHGRSNTHCLSCGNVLIKRDGYRTVLSGIIDKHCTKCGTDIGDYGIIN